MRVLVVSQYFWPEEFRINEVCQSLVERGHSVEVLTGLPNYPSGKFFDGWARAWGWGCVGKREQNSFVKIFRVPLVPRGQNRIQLTLNYLSFVVMGCFFGSWRLRKRKYDILFVYAPSPIISALPALLMGWVKQKPVVIWVQDLWPDSVVATGHIKNKFVVKLLEFLVRFIYRRADLLLAQSHAFLGPLRRLSGSTEVKYFPNSVGESFAGKANEKCVLKSRKYLCDLIGSPSSFVVLFAGNIGVAQSVDVILAAATRVERYQKIQFVVLGEGSKRQWMLSEVSKRKLSNVHLPGRLPSEQMPAFMQLASALLVTLADEEIFAATVPYKIQAYLASGRPIIASMPGEGGRIVRDAGAGISVRPEDGEALAQAVLKLYQSSSSVLNRYGTNGRRYFESNYMHERLIDDLQTLLEDALES